MNISKIVFSFLLSSLVATTGFCEDKVLQGEGVAGDWLSDAPGLEHRITVVDLPAVYATESAKNHANMVAPAEGAKPKVPEGFEVNIFAKDISNPRKLVTAPNGDIFVVQSSTGTIRILRDTDGDGVADYNEKFADGLKQPFGLAFYPPGPNPEYVYVGNTNGIVRLPYKVGDTTARGPVEHIADLSSGGRLEGGGHWTRDIVFSLDGKKLYASVGSKSNDDETNDPVENDRARIFEFNPDGSGQRVYAWGIRNAVGLAVNPTTGVLWASVNERDGLGDDLVPDYITQVKDGGFYGWPWFYLGKNQDPRHPGARPDLADQITIPDVLVQAHVASLNMLFYEGKQFPEKYQGDAFAAFHGSWNRAKRTGYKVVRVPLKDGKPQGIYEDFMTGFVNPNGDVWGRPVGLTVAKDGSLLVSEDGNNTIWRVSYKK
jgi:glucose/arabinose dehydrogenase